MFFSNINYLYLVIVIWVMVYGIVLPTLQE